MKRTYILILGLFLVVLLLGTILVLSLLQPKNQSPTTSTVLPTPTPVAYSIPRKPKTLTTPSIPTVFKPKETQKILQALEYRQPLSTIDAKIKTKLINSVPQNAENIITNNEFAVDYIQPLDLFQVEIKISNIDKAKTDAVTWFLSEGMTNDGVCKLPVTFYLEYSILQQIKEQGIQFSPISNGC